MILGEWLFLMSEVLPYHGNDEQCLEFSIEYAGKQLQWPYA